MKGLEFLVRLKEINLLMVIINLLLFSEATFADELRSLR
jgi:hypothetical protein